MNYAIISNDAIAATGTVKALWPGTSFSDDTPNADWLEEKNAVAIRSDLPFDNATEYLQRVEPYLLNGIVWDRTVVTRPAAVPEPNWQTFQLALLTDAQVHAMMSVAKEAFPGLISAWSTGLGQAAVGQGLVSFGNQWALGRQLIVPDGLPGSGLPLVSDALADHVATLAEASHLPTGFIALLEAAP
jgi:hypothetical protein